MKRIGCMLVCIILILAGISALAWVLDPNPLEDEPFYDPSSGILSGTLVWSDFSAAMNGIYQIHYKNLETGEDGSIRLDGYHYLVYSDLPGALVAKESGEKLFLCQMDLEGNLSPVLETEFPSKSYMNQGIHATVYACYDGWIYYNLNEDYYGELSLARVRPDGNKLFVYRTISKYALPSLAPNGMVAWFEGSLEGRDATTLIIQNPEDGSVTEIPFTGEYSDIRPVPGQPVWKDKDTLVFCGIEGKDTQSHPLYAYHLSSKSISPVKGKNGRHIFFPQGFLDGVQLNSDKSQLFVDDLWWDFHFCVVDIQTAEYFKIDHPNRPGSYDRPMWYNE